MHQRLVLSILSFSLLGPSTLLAEQTVAPPNESGFMQTLVMLAIAMLFFYFILFRPEQKRRKALEEQRSSLKKGDRVTAMGIIGTVSKVQEDTIILSMVDGAKIEVIKGAVTEILSQDASSSG